MEATDDNDEVPALLDDGGAGRALLEGGGGGGGGALLAGAGVGLRAAWAAASVVWGTLTVMPAFAQKLVENLRTADPPIHQLSCS